MWFCIVIRIWPWIYVGIKIVSHILTWKLTRATTCQFEWLLKSLVLCILFCPAFEYVLMVKANTTTNNLNLQPQHKKQAKIISKTDIQYIRSMLKWRKKIHSGESVGKICFQLIAFNFKLMKTNDPFD